MRVLSHPPVEAITVEGVLFALSDPVRVAIFAQIAGAGCTQTCSDFLRIGDRPIPKSTLSHHFQVLRESGLIRSERHGVEMRSTSRCAEIESRFPGLLPSILDAMRIQREGEPVAASSKGRVLPGRSTKRSPKS